MACIKTIEGVQTVACGAPTLAGAFGRPVSAKFINANDIASYSVSGGFATITRVVGATAAAELETANNSLVINLATKGGEMYPQAWDVSIEFSLFRNFIESDALGVAYGLGANARGVFAFNFGGACRVIGLGYPLECLSIEGASNGNGYPRITFGVEDWQPGTTIYRITTADYNALSTVAGGGGVTPTPTPDTPSGGGGSSTQKECDGSGILSDGTKCPGCIMCDPLG